MLMKHTYFTYCLGALVESLCPSFVTLICSIYGLLGHLHFCIYHVWKIDLAKECVNSKLHIVVNSCMNNK